MVASPPDSPSFAMFLREKLRNAERARDMTLLVWYIIVSMLYMDILEPRVLEHTSRIFTCNNYVVKGPRYPKLGIS